MVLATRQDLVFVSRPSPFEVRLAAFASAALCCWLAVNMVQLMLDHKLLHPTKGWQVTDHQDACSN